MSRANIKLTEPFNRQLSPAENRGKICPGCLCKISGFDTYTPTPIMRLKQTDCKDCMGWTVAPIPPVEVGLNNVYSKS